MSDLSKTNICPFCKNSKAYGEYHRREDLLMNKALEAAIGMLAQVKPILSRSDGWKPHKISYLSEAQNSMDYFEHTLKAFQEFNMDMASVAEEVMKLEKSLSDRIQ